MLHFQYGEKGRIGRFEGEEVQYEATRISCVIRWPTGYWMPC